MKKTRYIPIVVTPEKYARIRAAAKARGCNVSQLIREAIDLLLGEKK